MRWTRRVAMTALMLLMGYAAGCAVGGPRTGQAGGGYSDARVEQSVLVRLQEDDVTNRSTFGVSVKDGIATVRGSVPDEPTRMRVLSVVRSTTGVRDVIDRLERW